MKNKLWRLYLIKGIILASCITTALTLFLFLSIFETAQGNIVFKVTSASIAVATISLLVFYIYFIIIKTDKGHIEAKAVVTPFLTIACFVTAVTCIGGCLALISVQNNTMLIGSVFICNLIISLVLFFFIKEKYISKTIGGILIGFFITTTFLVTIIRIFNLHTGNIEGIELGTLSALGIIALTITLIFSYLSKKSLEKYICEHLSHSNFLFREILRTVTISCVLTICIALPLFLFLKNHIGNMAVIEFLRERAKAIYGIR